MAPTHTERNGIHIIDLQKTVKKLEEAYNFVRQAEITSPCRSWAPSLKLRKPSRTRLPAAVSTTSTPVGWAASMTNFKDHAHPYRPSEPTRCATDGTFDMLPRRKLSSI